MKISKNTNYKKALILLISAISIVSCKKETHEETRPKTAADFEKLMSTDKNILAFSNSAYLLYKEKQKSVENSFSVVNTNLTQSTAPKSKSSMEDVLKKAKNKADVINVFNQYNIVNATTVANLLETQNNSFFAFAKDYPEFASLPKEDKETLLLNILKKNSADAKKVESMIKMRGNGMKVMVGSPDECAYSFNSDYESCEFNYYAAMIPIWAGVVIASGDTAGLGAPGAVLLGFIATAVNYGVWDYCVTKASNEFFHCMGM